MQLTKKQFIKKVKRVMFDTGNQAEQQSADGVLEWVMRSFFLGFTLFFSAGVLSQEVTFKEKPASENSASVRDVTVQSDLFERHAAQREIYLELKQKVIDGDFAQIERRRGELDGYPLEYYLDYLVLRHRIERAEHPLQLLDPIAGFERRYGDRRLHRRLLGVMKNRLVRLNHWKSYATVARLDNAPVHPCDDLFAKVKNRRIAKADDSAVALWSEPARHTKNCNKAFAQLVQNPSDVSTRALWQRTVALLLQRDELEINKLLPFFSLRDRKTVQAWVQGLENPEATLKNRAAEGKTPHHRKVATYLLRRWARDDLVGASAFWQANGQRFGFSDSEVAAVVSKYAVLAAKRRMPESAALLADAATNRSVRYWRVRVALLEQNWTQALRALDSLTSVEQQSSRWQYWRARCLANLGRADEADTIFRVLADDFGYFGFLSADQLSLPYNIEAEAPRADSKALQVLADHPDIVRAIEFFLTGTGWEGRRLWNAALKTRGKEYHVAAARLAMSVNWVDRALASMESSEEKKALDVLFPTPYQRSVSQLASHHSVASELIYGVMKQESAFIPDIKSSAGAVGLMQLMPPTARDMGKKLGVKVPGWKLTNSELNLRLGVTYLKYVLDRFGKNTVLATAAYNAGPHRVSQWITDRSMPADIWVETIPFDETRRYVRAVLFNTTVSEWRMQKGTLTRLRQRMPDVLPLG
jgi:soluble lytic murein transglycosylase